MSFYINNNNQNRPCTINSNALNGICEKVLIEVNKVFDACLSRDDNLPYSLVLTDFFPASPALPLTFITADSIPTQPVVITATSIERIESRPNFANVSLTIAIPIQVNFNDANGAPVTARSTLTVTKSVVLFMPQDSLTPLQISANAFFSSQIGTLIDGNTLNVTGCLQVIVKVIAQVDILVPSFGYPCLPPCHELAQTDQNCPNFFNQPIYPIPR